MCIELVYSATEAPLNQECLNRLKLNDFFPPVQLPNSFLAVYFPHCIRL